MPLDIVSIGAADTQRMPGPAGHDCEYEETTPPRVSCKDSGGVLRAASKHLGWPAGWLAGHQSSGQLLTRGGASSHVGPGWQT